MRSHEMYRKTRQILQSTNNVQPAKPDQLHRSTALAPCYCRCLEMQLAVTLLGPTHSIGIRIMELEAFSIVCHSTSISIFSLWLARCTFCSLLLDFVFVCLRVCASVVSIYSAAQINSSMTTSTRHEQNYPAGVCMKDNGSKMFDDSMQSALFTGWSLSETR